MTNPQGAWTCSRVADTSPAPRDDNPPSSVSTAPNPSFNLTTTLPRSTLLPFLKPKADWLADYHKTADNSKLFGVGTTALVFNDEDRILLVKRHPGDSMPNLWECPGGGVDKEDQTLLDAAARELKEEAGLQAVSVLGVVVEGEERPERPLWWAFTNRSGSKLLARVVFEMGVESFGPVELKPDEHTDYVWATEDEVKAGWSGEKAIPMSTWQMMGIVLDGFRLRRERKETESRGREQKRGD